jgi:hypothetical protein
MEPSKHHPLCKFQTPWKLSKSRPLPSQTLEREISQRSFLPILQTRLSLAMIRKRSMNGSLLWITSPSLATSQQISKPHPKLCRTLNLVAKCLTQKEGANVRGPFGLAVGFRVVAGGERQAGAQQFEKGRQKLPVKRGSRSEMMTRGSP